MPKLRDVQGLADANLKILALDADVDNCIQATYADPNDIEAEVVSSRGTSRAHIVSD